MPGRPCLFLPMSEYFLRAARTFSLWPHFQKEISFELNRQAGIVS